MGRAGLRSRSGGGGSHSVADGSSLRDGSVGGLSLAGPLVDPRDEDTVYSSVDSVADLALLTRMVEVAALVAVQTGDRRASGQRRE